MLQFIVGRAGTGKTTHIWQAIRQRAAAGKRSLLLVPEQFASTADLTGFTVNIQRVSLTDDPSKVDCRWQIFIGDDPAHVQKGWKIVFGEWDEHIDTPHIQDIMDSSNG